MLMVYIWPVVDSPLNVCTPPLGSTFMAVYLTDYIYCNIKAAMMYVGEQLRETDRNSLMVIRVT